jgi:hypothetical protein
MAVFKAWIKVIEVPDVSKTDPFAPGELAMLNDAATAGASVLKVYLDRCVKRMSPKAFTQAQVGISPTSSQIGSTDVVIHLTQSSVIRSSAAWQNLTIQGGGNAPGGATAEFPQGALSEVFWIRVKNSGKTATDRGKALANLAIHELAHNKCIGIPGQNFVQDVHTNGGGGLFDTSVSPALVKMGDLNTANEQFLAGVLARPVKQYVSWLFSDELGF